MNFTFINNNIFIIDEAFRSPNLNPESKRLLLLISESEADNELSMAFLHKILAAIRCEPNQDTWLHAVSADKKFSISEIRRSKYSNTVIIFGIEPPSLGIHVQMKKYVFTAIADTSYLYCDSLEEIEKHTPLKAALWDALKKQLT